MTGYGEAEGESPAGLLRVELRSVNHRYLNVNVRIPGSLSRLENDLREWLRGPFSRGSLNCTVRLEPLEGESGFPGFQLDEERVEAYLAAFAELQARYQVRGTPDLALLARYSDILVRRESEDEDDPELAEQVAAALRGVLERAAEQTLRMREEEGRRLADDLEERLRAIEAALDEIQRLAPERLVRERDRLRDAVGELLGGRGADPDRIAQEIALLAERWDINEELVRFRSHIELFRDLMAEAAAEPVGKRLSFLVQEMHREANTVGSKANSASISHRVVAIKDEIERLREQVENVE